MNENTLYLYQNNDELIEINIYSKIIHKISYEQIFEKYCLKEITTLKGRIDAAKKILSASYNVPIYINHNLVFIKINCPNTIWINIVNIKEIINKKNLTIIVFRGGLTVEINKNYRSIRELYQRALELINNKNGFIL